MSGAPTIVATQRGARLDFQQRLRARGVEVLQFDFLTPDAVARCAARLPGAGHGCAWGSAWGLGSCSCMPRGSQRMRLSSRPPSPCPTCAAPPRSYCHDRGFLQCLWECGGMLAAPAIAGGAIHKAMAFVAPKLVRLLEP